MEWTKPRETIPGPQFKLADVLRKEMRNKNSVRPLQMVKKTKVFLQAVANDVPFTTAKRLAHVSGSVEKIMDSPASQVMLEEVLRHPQFQDQGITSRLKEMWNHKKIKAVKVAPGSATMARETVIEEDDTDMWKYSMDRVLELRGLKKQDKKENEGETPGTIVASHINFNVLQIPESKAA
jgi:hypothetical protein